MKHALPFRLRRLVSGLLFLIPLLTFGSVASPSGDPDAVRAMRGLVAFWTFGEEAGNPRLSSGTPNPHPLQEVGGPVARVDGGHSQVIPPS